MGAKLPLDLFAMKQHFSFASGVGVGNRRKLNMHVHPSSIVGMQDTESQRNIQTVHNTIKKALIVTEPRKIIS